MATPEDLVNLPENTTPGDENQMSIQNSSGKWYRMAFSTMVSFFTDFFVSLTAAQSISGIKNFLAKITVLDPVGNNEPETKGRMDALKGSGYEDNPKTIEEIIEGVIVPPTYVTPTLSNIEIDPPVIEVGEDASILLSWDLSQNDGGSPDYDTIIFEFDGEEVDKSDYINGTPFFYYENVVGAAPSTDLLSVILPYAQGPVKNDLTFGDPYPTGQIPAGNMSGSANLEIKYYSLHGSSTSLPTSANIRSVGSQTGNLTFTNAIQSADTVSFVFIPSGYELVSIIDTSNLNADLTNDYELQAEDTMPDGGGNDYSGNYYALFFSPYGSVTNHVITIKEI